MFLAAVTIRDMKIIAEAKIKSPFGWHAKETWEERFAIANAVGDIISIHTDERWGGSFELVSRARELTDKPILAKGIHETDGDIEEALKHGADLVLVVGRVSLAYVDQCLFEPYTIEDLKKLPPRSRAVWNSRDLSTGGFKKEQFTDARKAFGGWLCQASNIRTMEDIDQSADAVLIGTHLPEMAPYLAELRR